MLKLSDIQSSQLVRLALNAGKHSGNQSTRLAHLDNGNDRAIWVQGDEGPAQSLPRRRPIGKLENGSRPEAISEIARL